MVEQTEKKIESTPSAPMAKPSEEPKTLPMAKPAEPKQDPNIVFVGKKKVNGELVAGDPPTSVKDGFVTFDLPSAKEQTDGFYHPNASRIIRAFPQLYKQFVKKGE